MDHLTERNSSLLRHVAEVEGANAAVQSQLQEFHQKLRLAQVDNNLLQQQIAFFQTQQKVSIMVSSEFTALAWCQIHTVLLVTFLLGILVL